MLSKVIRIGSVLGVMVLGLFTYVNAQNVGIGIATPDISAKLDISDPNRGILIPRVALTSTTDNVTIPNPAHSLLVYNTGSGGLTPAGYYYNSGTPTAPQWIRLLTTNDNDQDWVRVNADFVRAWDATDSVLVGSTTKPSYPFEFATYNGSPDGTHIGLGSVEYITDDLSLTTINNDFGPASTGLYYLGLSSMRWDYVFGEAGRFDEPATGVYALQAVNVADSGWGAIGRDFGVYGDRGNNTTYGYIATSNYGVYGGNVTANSPYGGISSGDYGVYGNGGIGSSTRIGVYGIVGDGTSRTEDFKAVYGYSNNTNRSYGYGGYFIGEWRGVYAQDPDTTSGRAGYFSGKVDVSGTLTAGAKNFLIDHPDDPENKILRHISVESNEYLIIYRGKIKLDQSGTAIVKLPDYFKGLTDEENATVVLTSIGKPFLTGYEWETDYKSFKVYGEPLREVSWMVMAERNDPSMKLLREPIVIEKNGDAKGYMKGYYLYPEAFGQPWEKSYDYLWHHKDNKIPPPPRRLSAQQKENNNNETFKLKENMKYTREFGTLEEYKRLKQEYLRKTGHR